MSPFRGLSVVKRIRPPVPYTGLTLLNASGWFGTRSTRAASSSPRPVTS